MLLEPRWFVVVGAAALAYGSLSPVVSARRLQFLAASLPHGALLATVLGIPLSSITGLPPSLCALAVGIPLTYMVVILVRRGVPEETATSVFVSFTASASIAAIYLVLTRYPSETSLWSYIIGDPLLVTWRDTAYAAAVSAIVVAMTLPFMREHVLLGLDRDSARLTGLRASLYDYMAYTALALAAIGLIRVVGFVLEHVLILLPAAVATNFSKSGAETVYNSVASAVAAGMAGILLAAILGQNPSAMVGFLLLAFYLTGLVRGGAK